MYVLAGLNLLLAVFFLAFALFAADLSGRDLLLAALLVLTFGIESTAALLNIRTRRSADWKPPTEKLATIGPWGERGAP